MAPHLAFAIFNTEAQRNQELVLFFSTRIICNYLSSVNVNHYYIQYVKFVFFQVNKQIKYARILPKIGEAFFS